MVKKYRTKPVCIEAVQFTRNNWDEVVSFTNRAAHTLMIEQRNNGTATCLVATSEEGAYFVVEYDYIIKGTHGEFYSCNHDNFEKLFEQVE